jgi:hypothetical protein
MKNNLLIVLFLSMTFVYGQKVTGDYEKSTDFSAYKTYMFVGWQDDSDQVMNDFDKKRLRESIKSEMEARQFELVESDADMAVSLFVVVDEKTSTTAYTNYYGGAGYGRGRRGYGGWGHGSATTSYSENDYLQGTLVLDMYDAASKDLIWQGVATGTITEKPEKREKKIPKAVTKLMKKFPVDKVK